MALLAAALLAAPIAAANTTSAIVPGLDGPQDGQATVAPDGGSLDVTTSGPCWYVIFDAEVGPVYVDVTHCDPEVDVDDPGLLP